MGNIFNTIFTQPLGWVLKFFYDLTNSYGLALIIFTVLVKLVLLPIGVHQQKSILKQIRIKPKEDLVRKKYAHDKELQSKKVMELYKRENYNVAGGCLPQLIQLPFLWVLYSIINSPMSYIQMLSKSTIAEVLKFLNAHGAAIKGAGYNQIPMSRALAEHGDLLNQLIANKTLPAGFHPISFNFLGLDLSGTPSLALNALLLIPLISALTSFLSSKVMQRATAYTSAGNNNQTMKSMMYFSPVMSLVITFSLPVGVGLYWIINNILMIGQSLLLNKIYSPAKAAEEAKESIRKAVELRKKRKAELASQKSDGIEAKKLADKNMRRKKAGLPPLESLEGSSEDSKDEDDTDE